MSLNIGKLQLTFKSLKRVEDKIAADVERRYSDLEKRISQYLKTTIINAIKLSPVYNALTHGGQGKGYDLGAEFGIRPSEALRAAALLIPILQSTVKVKIQTKSSGGPNQNHFSFSVKCTLLERKDYYDALTSSSPFKYTAAPYVGDFKARAASFKKSLINQGLSKEQATQSYRKQRQSETVQADWMAWLLNANRGLAFMKESPGFSSLDVFGIKYGLTTEQQKYSRSGRALMLSTQPKSFTVTTHTGKRKQIRRPDVEEPYEFPQVAIPRNGALNFIDEITKDQKFKDRVDSGLKNILKTVLKTYNPNYFNK